MTFEITPIQRAEFDGMRAEWNDLLSRSGSDNVFLRWEWIHTWWTIFNRNRKLLILAARQDGRLAGIAPLCIEPRGLLGTRYLIFCSDDLSPDYMDFIMEADKEQDIARSLIEGMAARAQEWDILMLDNLRSDSTLLTHPSLLKDHVHAIRKDHICPYIEVAGSFAEYYRTRSQLDHFGLDKKWKKLSEQMNVVYRMADDDASVAKGLDDLFALHDLRSEDKRIDSNFTESFAKRFHHALAPLFLKEGILDLQLLYDGKTPISAIYSFNYKKKVYMYQTGLAPEWKKWSAGGVLVLLAVRKAFRDGFKEYDFLKGREYYKSLWTSVHREEVRLTVYGKTPRSAVHRTWHLTKSALKRVKRRLSGM